MELLGFLFLSLIFLLYLYVQFIARNKPQGFKDYPLIGPLPELLQNRHHCHTNTAVFSRPYKLRRVVAANPNNVQHILKTKFNNYPKGQRSSSRPRRVHACFRVRHRWVQECSSVCYRWCGKQRGCSTLDQNGT
ncbi:hypothetical protein VNO78_16792 [Psophocarpus tetragonolobus]|uniref:Cytochrome P450 n=1 Tax=Psophocarpus tetragonolobus TaxID=3891 RepID=A0AAN9XKP9_PSOTE